MKRDLQEFALRGTQMAERLRDGLAGQRLIERFVDAYADQHDRSGLRSSPLRYRELLITINRESWLALAARVETLLPEKLSRRRPPVLRGPEAAAADSFRESFLDELGSALHWMASDREEFTRDLILYGHIAARQPRAMSGRRAPRVAEGAFVDRCALLLDPSLLDQARNAASRLLLDLESLAEKAFSEVFQARRARAPRPKSLKARKRK